MYGVIICEWPLTNKRTGHTKKDGLENDDDLENKRSIKIQITNRVKDLSRENLYLS